MFCYITRSLRCPLDSVTLMQIVGTFEQGGQKLPHTLTGKWDTALEAGMPDGSKQRIWQSHPAPAETTRYARAPKHTIMHCTATLQQINPVGQCI